MPNATSTRTSYIVHRTKVTHRRLCIECGKLIRSISHLERNVSGSISVFFFLSLFFSSPRFASCTENWNENMEKGKEKEERKEINWSVLWFCIGFKLLLTWMLEAHYYYWIIKFFEPKFWNLAKLFICHIIEFHSRRGPSLGIQLTPKLAQCFYFFSLASILHTSGSTQGLTWFSMCHAIVLQLNYEFKLEPRLSQILVTAIIIFEFFTLR